MIFKQQRKKVNGLIKLKFICKRLYPAKSVKYIDFKIDENLNRKQHIHYIEKKLNRAKTFLSTIRNHANKHTMRIIYLALFNTHMNQAYLI